MKNFGVLNKIWRQFSAACLVLTLLGCSGMTSSLPNAREVSGPPSAPSALSPQAQGETPTLAAAGPTQEGILSAPADDDSVQTTSKKFVHFEAFLPKDYQDPLSQNNAWLPTKDLKFLVKVGEATKEGCKGMADPTCWKWLDPNLLMGLVVRAKVFTVVKSALPDHPGVFLMSPGWFYQDFKISELQPDGYNLSLVELGAEDKDRIELTLFNTVPDDYSPTQSATSQGYASEVKGKGYHFLGEIEIGDLTALTVYE